MNLNKKISKNILFILIFLLVGTLFGKSEIMLLKDVKVGQKGKALTAVEGNRIIEIEVEIISILNNVFPQKSLILARLSGEQIEYFGVAQGMSGSPVYIDGKIAGAISYSFPFSKEAVAGITPIEDMLESTYQDSSLISSSNLDYKRLMGYMVNLYQYKNADELNKDFFNLFPRMISANNNEVIKPIPFLLYKGMKSFSPIVEQWWIDHGFIPVLSFGTSEEIGAKKIKEGDAIAVKFLSGDMEIGGIGTVSYIDKNKVYAFGHPMFNLGNISLPMASAEINAVVPNIYSSFKVGNVGKIIGTFKQDLSSAVFGFLDEAPPTIPMKLKISTGKVTKDYNFILSEHNLLTPLIANIALNETFASTDISYYEGTYEINGEINIDGYQNIIIDNVFAGFLSLDQSSTYIASILGYMLNNEFDKIKVKSINLNANIDSNQRIAEIKQIKYDKSEVKRGEMINLEIYIKPYLKDTKKFNYQLEISNKIKKGIYYVYVGGASDLNRIDYDYYYNLVSVDDLKQVIRLINTIKRNNKIYIRIARPSTSIIVKNKLLNNIPPSHFDIMFSSQTVGEVNRVFMEPILEDSLSSEYMVKGMKRFIINVKN